MEQLDECLRAPGQRSRHAQTKVGPRDDPKTSFAAQVEAVVASVRPPLLGEQLDPAASMPRLANRMQRAAPNELPRRPPGE